MGKHGTISKIVVVKGRHGMICAGASCQKEIKEGKPAVKVGKDIFCLGCAEKQGYRLSIPFEVESDYVVVEGSLLPRICGDCGARINLGASHFRNKNGTTYFCEECGAKRGYKGSKKATVFKDPLKASKQAAYQGKK